MRPTLPAWNHARSAANSFKRGFPIYEAFFPEVLRHAIFETPFSGVNRDMIRPSLLKVLVTVATVLVTTIISMLALKKVRLCDENIFQRSESDPLPAV